MKNKLTTLFLAILFLFITFYTAHSGINDIKKSINVNKITSVDESPSNITPMKSIKTLKKSNKHNEIINTKQLEKEIYNYYDYSSIFLPQAKTLKIKIKDKIKTILRPNTIKLPNYLLKAIKPQQIKASSFKMPVRIDETSQNKENYNPYDLIPPPEFPPTQDNPDTVEAEGFLIINKIFSHLASLPPPSPFMDEAEINKILVACYTVLEAFSNYEHICALTKFYIAECYRRQRFYNFGWGVMFDSFYKNDLLYKIYEQNLKEYENSENPYCKYVCDKIKYRLEEVNNKLLKLEKEIPDLKETITYHKGELEKLKDIVYDSYPNPEVDTTPDSSYSSILLNYEKIMVTYYNMGKKGNDPEVIALKNEFLSFYDSIPPTFPLKYRLNNQGEILTLNYPTNRQSSKKLSMNTIPMLMYSAQTEEDPNNETLLKMVSAYADNIENFIPLSTDNSSDTEIKELKEIKAAATFCKKRPDIQKIYFAKEANNLNDEIYQYRSIIDPLEKINLRCLVPEPSPMPSFKVKIKSSVSEKEKELILKVDRIYGGYYCLFQPNSNDIQDKSNMILNTKNSQNVSISTFRGEEKGLSNPVLYNNTQIFKNQLGRSSVNEITENKIIKNSYQVLKSGGFESIMTINFALTAEVLARNQADWFVIAAHGGRYTGSIGEHESNPNAIIINPQELINKKNVSNYSEDIDVLILAACSCLRRPAFIKSWQNVLPEGIILGYREDTLNVVANRALTNLNKELNQNHTSNFDELGNLWLKANKDIYKQMLNSIVDRMCLDDTYFYASYIYNNFFWFFLKSCG